MAHYCKEHDIQFEKHTKEDKVWYSHKKEDGSWCNEPKGEEKSESPKKNEETKSDMSKKDWAEKDRIERDSIEAQVAVKAIVDFVVADKIKTTDPLFLTAKNWIANKLANWSSMGQVEEPIQEAPQTKSSSTKEKTGVISPIKPTTEQLKRLSIAIKKWDTLKAKELLIERWKTNETKHLNREQMEDFITQLEKGCEEPKIDPENIPF